MDTTQRIGLDRLGLLVAPEGAATPHVVSAVLAELAHVGVRVKNPEAATDGLAGTYKEVVKHVRKLRGERRTYAPLFKGFPDQLPEYDDAELRFHFAATRLVGTNYTEDDVRDALDFTGIGWWPASSVGQDVEKARIDRAVQELLPKDTRVQWMTLELVSESVLDERLKGYMQDCFSSAASLRDDVKKDLDVLVEQYGVRHVDADAVRFRENRTLLLKLIWEKDRSKLSKVEATPDDVLRLFAALTDGDVSLTEKIRYPKLSRSDRRVIVNTLEASPRLSEIFRRRGLWLAVEKGLHVGEYRAPKVQEAFTRLRSTRHDKTSFGSRFEALLGADYAGAVELAGAEAPGVLGRSLRRLMSLADDQAKQGNLVTALSSAGERIPLRILLAARAQVADNGASYPRVVFTKGGTLLPISNAPGHLAVAEGFQQDVLSTLDQVIAGQIEAKGSWAGERVYVDPDLDKVLLPDQLRSTAQGLVQVERGTRLPLGEGKVARLFVHWKEDGDRSDLDLSCIALDADFGFAGQVSWTNLGNGAMTHSGDLTSAPDGAEEFLDIDLAKAKSRCAKSGWRYLVPSIFRYSGPKFDDLAEANAGWMLRDSCSSDVRTFDPATVVNAFALTGGKQTAVPFLLDLETDEILYVDVYLSGYPGASVETDSRGISSVVRSVAMRSATKASVSDLATYHVLARGGELVANRDEATITFGTSDDDTYNAVRPEKILAELL